MTFLTKLYIGIALAAVLAGGFFAFKHSYDNQKRLEGQFAILTKQLTARDSAQMHEIQILGKRLTNQVVVAGKTIEHFHDTVNTIINTIPGKDGRVDTVFTDSSFRALPPDVQKKIRDLIASGASVANSCSDLVNTCQIFHDSAFAIFHTKDSLITVAKAQFGNKARRPCGLGGTIGPSAGFASVKSDTSAKRIWRPAWGVFGTIGLTCSL